MKPCARKWQVEAARDGRLRGKDLDSAERHRETCAECAQEASALAKLSQAVAKLPTLTLDPITVHRTRQHLLSTFNESVLEPTVKRVPPRAALVFGGAAVLLTLLWLVAAGRAPQAASTAYRPSFVRVESAPEARWTEHLSEELDRIDFSGGSATFKVRPHPGRRVIISLPDGEIEDLGTVFTILVRDRATKRVAVSEGRVLLRLHGRPETTVSAGESWDAQAPLAQPSEASQPGPPPSGKQPLSGTQPASSPAPANTATVSNRRPAVVSARAAATAVSSAQRTPAAPSKSDTESTMAEDDAYLRVVGLLRAGEQDEARVEAKRYLLRFPNGFRRVEVLNIVTR